MSLLLKESQIKPWITFLSYTFEDSEKSCYISQNSEQPEVLGTWGMMPAKVLPPRFFRLFVWVRFSLWSPGWPWTFNLPAFASWVGGYRPTQPASTRLLWNMVSPPTVVALFTECSYTGLRGSHTRSTVLCQDLRLAASLSEYSSSTYPLGSLHSFHTIMAFLDTSLYYILTGYSF
jgi:hypothetical protein